MPSGRRTWPNCSRLAAGRRSSYWRRAAPAAGGPTATASVADVLATPGRIVLGMQSLWPAMASPPFWVNLFERLTAAGVQPVDDALFAAREWLVTVGAKYFW